MRRLLVTALTLVAAVAGTVALSGAGGDDPGAEYWVELDNAFGLIEGGDLKIAGVRAGQITEMKLDERTKRALVGIRIDETGFGSLRRDVRCESRPQSLIGEYFLDCLPGTAKAELEPGSTVPVAQTGSTVAPDLVNNILRRPYRERFALILGELGAGVAGGGEALNEAVRRAAPALRETDKVLSILARQNQVLADLARNADRVVGDLAGNRKDVGRFVVEARDTARASAARKRELAGGFRRLPGFLRRLTPTMAALGQASDAQAGALTDLRASARGLERLFANLKPFADASTPAFKALGGAAEVGRDAVRDARPVAKQLQRFGAGTPELAKNLAIVLEHLDDRDFAVEPDDPRSPGGYTGLEALLTYVFDQTLSTNVYDSTQHYLKVSGFVGECADFRDLEALKAGGKELEEHCGARVGPRPVGLVANDPTRPAAQARRRGARGPARKDRVGPGPADLLAPPAAGEPERPAPAAGGQRPGPTLDLPKLPGVGDLPPIQLPNLDGLDLRRDDARQDGRLLDFLMGD